jgi:hypothetical protein
MLRFVNPAQSKARAWHGGDVRKIYYALLFGFTVWGMIAVNIRPQS